MAKRADGWWYPWIFVGGMLLVIVVNGIMMFFATSTFTGLSTDDYYRKGAEYNKTIAAREAMEKLGWRVKFDFQAAPAGAPSRVSARFLDNDGQPISGLTVKIYRYRPTQDGHDAFVDLAYSGEGTYRAELVLPLPGIWDLRLLAGRGEEQFQSSHRIQVP